MEDKDKVKTKVKKVIKVGDNVSSVAHAIPDESWNKMVDTVVDTFKSLLSPITELTSGLGRLIQGKFNKLEDGEKVLVADTFSKASERVNKLGKSLSKEPNLNIVVSVIEESSKQTDDSIREFWTNLLANEMSGNSVHPEIPKLLSRMSAEDARRLIKIGQETHSTSGAVTSYIKSMKLHTITLKSSTWLGGGVIGHRDDLDTIDQFSDRLLENMDLIRKDENGEYIITAIGMGLLKAVS